MGYYDEMSVIQWLRQVLLTNRIKLDYYENRRLYWDYLGPDEIWRTYP